MEHEGFKKYTVKLNVEEFENAWKMPEELFRFICALSAFRHVSHTNSEIVIKVFKEAFQ